MTVDSSRYTRVPFDAASYEAETMRSNQDGSCPICKIASDPASHGHHAIYRDSISIAFLNKWPALFGYCLLAPLEHRVNVVADFSEDEYANLQRKVYRLGRALSAAVPTDRLYVLSLGSHQGNAHVHWHLAPLPPGVPYEQQQVAAMTLAHGYLDIPAAEQADLTTRIRRLMEIDHTT